MSMPAQLRTSWLLTAQLLPAMQGVECAGEHARVVLALVDRRRHGSGRRRRRAPRCRLPLNTPWPPWAPRSSGWRPRELRAPPRPLSPRHACMAGAEGHAIARIRPRPKAARGLRDGEVEIGVRIGFVAQRVVPPLTLVRAESGALHDGAKVPPVSGLDGRDALRSVV